MGVCVRDDDFLYRIDQNLVGKVVAAQQNHRLAGNKIISSRGKQASRGLVRGGQTNDPRNEETRYEYLRTSVEISHARGLKTLGIPRHR